MKEQENEHSQLINSIYQINAHLQEFEKRYGLASADFYELFSQGVLDDGEFEQTRDFCEWAGFYEIKRQREEEFATLSRQRLQTLRQQAAEGRLELTPQ
jgi:hypothetical protein